MELIILQRINSEALFFHSCPNSLFDHHIVIVVDCCGCVFLFCFHLLIVESIYVLVTLVDSCFDSIFVDKNVSGELTVTVI